MAGECNFHHQFPPSTGTAWLVRFRRGFVDHAAATAIGPFPLWGFAGKLLTIPSPGEAVVSFRVREGG